MSPRLLLLLLLALAACKPTLDEAVDSHAAAIDALISRAAAVAAHATAAPRLADTHRVEPVPPLDASIYPGKQRDDNFEFVHLEDLQALPELGYMPGLRRSPSRLHRCAALARTHREPRDPAQPSPTDTRLCGPRADVLLAHCANLRYLGVVRIHALIEPDVLPCTPPAPCSFRGGELHGDLLVYNLETGSLLGGAPFDVESPASLSRLTLTRDDVVTELYGQLYAAMQSFLAASTNNAGDTW